jgi:hypothetical protein
MKALRFSLTNSGGYRQILKDRCKLTVATPRFLVMFENVVLLLVICILAAGAGFTALLGLVLHLVSSG